MMVNLTIDDKKVEVTEGTAVLRAAEKASLIIPARDSSGPFGAKVAAEIPTDGVAPPVINAIYDAVGVRLHQIPATPERVWRALRETAS